MEKTVGYVFESNQPFLLKRGIRDKWSWIRLALMATYWVPLSLFTIVWVSEPLLTDSAGENGPVVTLGEIASDGFDITSSQHFTSVEWLFCCLFLIPSELLAGLVIWLLLSRGESRKVKCSLAELEEAIAMLTPPNAS